MLKRISVTAIMLCLFTAVVMLPGCDKEDEWVNASSSNTQTMQTETESSIIACGEDVLYESSESAVTATTTKETTTVTKYEDIDAGWSYLYAVPGKSMFVDVKGDIRKLEFTWYRDGELIKDAAGSGYNVTAEDLEHFISVDITRDGELLESLSMYVSRLPVMYIDTEDGAAIVSKEEYIKADMILQGNELYGGDTFLYNGLIEIRGRGNSTWKRFDKKPYKIKLDTKTDLFGMGANKHWVLLANYIDESLMRNALGFKFAESLGLTTMQGTWVDVVLNGEYAGNYFLCEQIRISDERVDIKNWEDIAEDAAKAIYKAEGLTKDERDSLEDALKTNLKWVTTGKVKFNGSEYVIKDYFEYDPNISEGYLLELSAEYDEISKFKTSTAGAPVMVKKPEYVNTNSEMFSYIKELVQAFEDAIYSEDGCTTYKGEAAVHYTELCNIDSLVDYWLVAETFYCPDAIWKSRYMYIGSDGKLTFGPVWDFDFSSGGKNPWMYIVYNDWRSKALVENNYWFGALIKQPDFIERVYNRYHEIRDTAIEELVKTDGIISEWKEYLQESGIANTGRWKYVQGFDKDVANLTKWLKNRVNWMDKQMKSLDTLKESLKTAEADTGEK